MNNYPIKQFPSASPIVLNLNTSVLGINAVNTKEGYIEIFLTINLM